jgi:protein-disulfide isomerase
MENQKENYLLPISIFLSTLLVVGAMIYSTGAKNTAQKNESNQTANLGQTVQEILKTDQNVVLGDPKAKVTVIIFSDFQCPYCGKFFQETESLIRKNYVATGKAKMIYKSLAFLGEESEKAAEATECAKDQGKFWQFHDALFEAEAKDGQERNGNLNENLFKKIASDLQMNTDDFLACLNSQKYAAKIQNNLAEAQAAMGANVATPSIIVNDKIIQGAYPYSVFSQIIDEILSK